jgi:hypothetical protein
VRSTASSVQEDYFYDANGSRIDYRYFAIGVPDIFKPSNAEVYLGLRNENEYDDQGLLIATTVEQYGYARMNPQRYRRTFIHDERGRCSAIDSPDALEAPVHQAFQYDDQGRISEIEIVLPDGLLFVCSPQHTHFEYDVRGRILERQEACGDRVSGSEVHTYNADGSEQIESYDGSTDVEVSSSVHRSPACHALDEHVGKRTDQRCRVASRDP